MKEQKLQEMRLARSNNLPESPKFQSQVPVVENRLRKDYSSPKELPTTKKSQMIPDSYVPRNTSSQQQLPTSNSPFGGRINDSFYHQNPSQSSLRR
jgi:hypothetical protein